jgi:membrane protease YdiL (CAAX protease family)
VDPADLAQVRPTRAGRGAAELPGVALLATAPRLHPGRAALLVVGFLALWLVLQAVPIGLLAASGLAPGLSLVDTSASAFAQLDGVVVTWLSLLTAVVAVVVLRRPGGPSFAAMGLRREPGWRSELGLGLALPPLLFAGILAIELARGWAVAGPGKIDAVALLFSALSFVAVACTEELVARGFLFQVIGRAAGVVVAVLVSSLLFGVAHVANPGASVIPTVGIVGAGLMFAWLYLATGRLWLPIAFHWSWNFAQGPLFGFPVSGYAGDGLVSVAASGPPWVTGGAFGPEAGALGLLAEVVAALTVFAWYRTRAR